MSFKGRLAWVFLGLWLLGLAPAYGKEKKPPKEPFFGQLADGRWITKAELDKILQEHRLWFDSGRKKGKQADLSGADLRGGVDLSGADLFKIDLSGAKLMVANLSGASLLAANLTGANLERANLEKAWLKANLSGATLSEANLSGADLGWANLSGAILKEANLTGAILREANLSGAYLYKANLNKADLARANLSEAKLWDANLKGAHLWGANLSGADLKEADLSDAYLGWANLKGARFEPKPASLPGAAGLLYLKGLDTLTFAGTASYGLVELREIFKKAGMRDEERQVTYALNHNRRINAWKEIQKRLKEAKETENKQEPKEEITWLTVVIARLENVFQLVFFEWTCDWGMTPSQPLLIMFGGLFVFTMPYLLAFRSGNRKTGIWLVLPQDESSKKHLFRLTNHTPFRPMPPGIWGRFKTKLSRGFRLVRLAFYFSLLSAFNLGWRELNVGNWISRLQKQGYTLQAKGWVRTVAGFQSLLSVYLLALWALTYFGRPFE